MIFGKAIIYSEPQCMTYDVWSQKAPKPHAHPVTQNIPAEQEMNHYKQLVNRGIMAQNKKTASNKIKSKVEPLSKANNCCYHSYYIFYKCQK